MATRAKKTAKPAARKAAPPKDKSLESWSRDAGCSIRGAKDAPKYKDYILPLIFTKRLGLADVAADIIGKSYEYLIRKFAEGGGQSAGEWSGATWTLPKERPEGEGGGAHQFYTPGEVGEIMARVLDPEPGMEIYDPTCGSGGLLIKCEIAMEHYGREKRAWGARFGRAQRARRVRPRRKRPNQYVAETWAMANMNKETDKALRKILKQLGV